LRLTIEAYGPWISKELDSQLRSTRTKAAKLVDEAKRAVSEAESFYEDLAKKGDRDMATKPDAASWAPNRLDIIVGGTDSGLWHRASTDGGATWLPWDSAGGIVTSDPSIVATGANALTIFVRGTDNQLWFRQSAGAGVWAAWTPLGGILTSAPQAASCFAGHMDVVVRGTDNTFYRKGSTDNGVTWSNWQQLQAGGTAGSWQSDPGVGCDPANGNLFVFGKDGSNSLTYFTELAT